jgi:hypothetical protein
VFVRLQLQQYIAMMAYSSGGFDLQLLLVQRFPWQQHPAAAAVVKLTVTNRSTTVEFQQQAQPARRRAAVAAVACLRTDLGTFLGVPKCRDSKHGSSRTCAQNLAIAAAAAPLLVAHRSS